MMAAAADELVGDAAAAAIMDDHQDTVDLPSPPEASPPPSGAGEIARAARGKGERARRQRQEGRDYNPFAVDPLLVAAAAAADEDDGDDEKGARR
jgi:hypothetical protein